MGVVYGTSGALPKSRESPPNLCHSHSLQAHSPLTPSVPAKDLKVRVRVRSFVKGQKSQSCTACGGCSVPDGAKVLATYAVALFLPLLLWIIRGFLAIEKQGEIREIGNTSQLGGGCVVVTAQSSFLYPLPLGIRTPSGLRMVTG